MTPRQQRFVEAYTDPEGGALGNATKAAVASHPDPDEANVGSQSTLGSRWLQQVEITDAIEAKLERAGAGQQIRLDQLGKIITGQYVAETVSTVDAGEGRRTTTTTKSRPTPTAIVKAIDQVARLDGSYVKTKAVGDALSSEFKAMARRFRPVPKKRKG